MNKKNYLRNNNIVPFILGGTNHGQKYELKKFKQQKSKHEQHKL